MPIVTGDLEYRLSGGAANADPDLSLGGAISSEVVPSDFFDPVMGAESAAGDTNYRCFYIFNDHPTLPLQNAVAWIVTNTTANRLAIGAGAAAVGAEEDDVADEDTAPSGVSFSQPTSKATGIALGTIPAGEFKAVWMRRVVAPGAAANNDTYQVRVEGDTGA